ncbi:MAG: hypothetical protein IPJ30_10780 [Acidobacteria bacterium]|nr:hypothetical protein [Acidobacteriota bacterium]
MINSGLGAGYSQVGKFLTVYPRNDSDAVDVAHELHELTLNSTSISVPFDRQYCAGSNVHMRYGAFAMLEVLSNNGQKMPAIRDSDGNLVPDDRLTIAPAWVKDPFPVIRSVCNGSFADTPLGERYRAFAAISQRGKGGVYLAVDLTDSKPRTCVVKQGRKNGEIGWDGQDGLFRVKTELRVLSEIGGKIAGVPAIYDSFEVNGSFYLVLEHVRGMNLESSLLSRRRRMSIGSIVSHSIEVCELLRSLHNSGWVWGDCKPANLVRSPAGALRPIDFEGLIESVNLTPTVGEQRVFPTGLPLSAGSAMTSFHSARRCTFFSLDGSMTRRSLLQSKNGGRGFPKRSSN